MKPDLSVVIPTYNRAACLEQTLEALAACRCDPPRFEVIVIDDGSTDGTREVLDRCLSAGKLDLRFRTQANSRPASARNHGTRLAWADLVLYLGDDTIPEPSLVRAHYRLHEASPGRVAVVGYTPYHPSLGRDPFLFFLQEMGHQFGYGLIEDPDDLPFNFVYSSNLSVPRELLGDGPFNEAIRAAAWEDVELGLRLKERGVRVLYEPLAVAYHLHAVTFSDFCRRQEMVGATSLQALEVNPGLSVIFGDGRPSRRILAWEWPLRFAGTALHGLRRLGFRPYAPRLFRAILDLHYHCGLRAAWRRKGRVGERSPARVGSVAGVDPAAREAPPAHEASVKAP